MTYQVDPNRYSLGFHGVGLSKHGFTFYCFSDLLSISPKARTGTSSLSVTERKDLFFKGFEESRGFVKLANSPQAGQ